MNDTLARLLRILRKGPAQPSELATQLCKNATEVLGAIEFLKGEGFDLAQHPILGWMLRSETESLSSPGILSRMTFDWLKRIHTLQSTSSTNIEAMNLGSSGDEPPLAVFAEHQTAGRGRFGRSWDSAAGEGIFVSLLLRPKAPQRHWPRLTSLAALATAEAVRLSAQVDVQIKWPNDIVYQGRKLAGILAETGAHPQLGPFVVLGIGINVNQSVFEGALSETATSIKLITGKNMTRDFIASSLLDQIGKWLVQKDGLGDGFVQILELVSNRSSTLGNTVLLQSGGVPVEGYAEGLDSDGCLRLRLRDGSSKVFSAGDVTLRAN